MKSFDVEISGSMGFYMVYPISIAAHDWVADNVEVEATFGGGFAVDSTTYVEDIALGMLRDGLTVSVNYAEAYEGEGETVCLRKEDSSV